MVGLAIVLLVVGILLFITEAFIPGIGILGISGFICIVISSIITIAIVPLGGYIVMAEAVILVVSIFFLVKYVKKKQLYGKLILDETLEHSEMEVGDLDYFIGKEGVTKTPLRPFGSVHFNGRDMEVCSEDGFIKEHSKVKVVRIENQRIMVTLIDKN